MKKTEIKKIKGKNAVELNKDLAAAREDLRAMRFDLVAGKVKNVRAITEAKKQIARILTFLKNK